MIRGAAAVLAALALAGCGGAGSCTSGQTMCGGACADTMSDARNCGGCGKACDQGYLCSAGGCAIECAMGLLQCERSCVDAMKDRDHCGDCKTACKGAEVCAAGKCAAACAMGTMNCGGACVDLVTDGRNCGKCGMVCAQGSACQEGACVVGCGVPLLACNAVCVDPRNDPENCGGCGMVCKAPANMGNFCEKGVCAVGQCAMGFTDCDGDTMTGCETATGTDVKNCGACKKVCATPPHAPAACSAGKCGLGACDQGFADCNMNPADGCESESGIDVNNCGKCGMVCPQPPNVVASCVNGACKLGACAPGFGDCNVDPKDGCETNLKIDARNCGVCGMICPMQTPACGNGVCAVLYAPAGVKNDVPVASLLGWTECYRDTFDNDQTPMTTILQRCAGNKLMLGCRMAGANTLMTVAWAPRADVLSPLVPKCGLVALHQANGVGWYYHDDYSWGFANGGDQANLCDCDLSGGNPSQRLCFHTHLGHINGGYRCGAATSLNADPMYERVIYRAD